MNNPCADQGLAAAQAITTRRVFLQQAAAAAAAVPLISQGVAAEGPGRGKGNLVFVVGTHHYHPEQSMPPLAKELDRLGFGTSVILPPGDPEENRNGQGVPGLELLEQAAAAVLFLRFLALDDKQFGHLERYLKSASRFGR